MLRQGPIVDAHIDLVLELVHRSGEDRPFARHWAAHLEAGGVALQVCALFAEPARGPEGALRQVMAQLRELRRAASEDPGRVVLVQRGEELDAVLAGNGTGLMIAMEGAEPLGDDVGLLEVFTDLGVRMVALTWERQNVFGTGAGEPVDCGLTSAGRRLLDKIDELGLVLDLAHASPRTFADAIAHVGGPTIVSHAGCRAVYDLPRNLTDDQIRAVASLGGVVGIAGIPVLIDPTSRSVSRIVDHLQHVVSLVGVDHVGLGADFTRQVLHAGALTIPPQARALLVGGLAPDAAFAGLDGPEGYPVLVEAMVDRGFDDDEVAAIVGGNVARLLRSAPAMAAGGSPRPQAPLVRS